MCDEAKKNQSKKKITNALEARQVEHFLGNHSETTTLRFKLNYTTNAEYHPQKFITSGVCHFCQKEYNYK